MCGGGRMGWGGIVVGVGGCLGSVTCFGKHPLDREPFFMHGARGGNSGGHLLNAFRVKTFLSTLTSCEC